MVQKSLRLYFLRPKKKYHVLLSGNSSKTDEPSNHPKYPLEPDRSGGGNEGEFSEIGPELVDRHGFKEKKYEL